MPTQRELSRRYRFNQIIEALQEQPRTCRELCERFDFNYNTCRKDLIDLCKDFKIHPTSFIRAGAIQYAAGSPNTMPTIFHPQQGKDYDIMEWCNGWINNGCKPIVPVNPVDDFMPSLVTLLGLMFNAKNSADQVAVHKNRVALLERVAKNRELLEMLLGVTRQLQNSPLLIGEKLDEFIQVNQIPSDEIESIVRKYYSTLNQTTEVNDD